MRINVHRPKGVLACTLVIFLLAFSFNAYACLLPLSGITDASMANGCSPPMEQPTRQLCDAFKTLGIESSSQSVSFLSDHHIVADHIQATLPVLSHHIPGTFHQYHDPFCTGSPPHQSLATTVLRI